MTWSLLIIWTAGLAVSQVPGDPAAGSEAAAGVGPIPSTLETRHQVLKQALADFDRAVATRDPGGLEAQQLYRRALTGFESLVDAGVRNGSLYYNIANTYLRMGDVGRAVVNYRRALRLSPGDEDIRKNLQSARNLCEVQVAAPATSALLETVLFWHFGTSPASRATFVLIAYGLFWLLMLLRLLMLRRSEVLTWAIRCVAALTLIVGGSVAWETLVQTHRNAGVVVADDVVLRKGNSEEYEPLLDRPLSAGVEFDLIEERPDVEGGSWYRIRLRDGKEGWLRADQADVV
jgi:tetratricopeptide (TPR) repeat protein